MELNKWSSPQSLYAMSPPPAREYAMFSSNSSPRIHLVQRVLVLDARRDRMLDESGLMELLAIP
jgi:hypothetical protein